MDGDLKRDLKTVRDKIRKGIKDVIDTLQVTKLDGLVKNDLGDLRQSIMDLQKKVKDKGDENDNIVAQQFKDLQSAKTQLEVVTGKDKGSIHQAVEDLDNKFSSEIHSPLSNAVGEVDMAIGKLGEKFQLTDGKKEKLGEIFGHIKEKVGEIKGQEGRGWKNTGASGLEGIVTGLVNSYANGFTGWEFNKRVTGWLEKTILPHNGLLKDKFAVPLNGKLETTNQSIAEKIRDKLQDDVGVKMEGADFPSDAKVQKTATAVKQACENFAKEIDAKLEEGGNGSVIVGKVKGELKNYSYVKNSKCICDCSSCNSNDECKKTVIVAAILCALSSTVRQVGNEIDSILLSTYRVDGKSMAQELDKVVEETRKLDEQLTQATKPGKSPPSQDTEIPAQAVDSTFGKVKKFVSETNNGDNITEKFKSKVIDELQKKVQELPEAVNQFDSEAQKQIRAAATTAITKAAGQIKMDKSGHIEFSGDFMKQFNDTYTQMKTKLPKDLQSLVDTHIGQDDTAGGKINIKDTFHSYNSHVKQDSDGLKIGTLKGQSSEGQLPEAIGNIKTRGLAELEKTIGSNDSGPINTKTFDEPFDKIQTELDEIKKLVNHNGGASFLTKATEEKGIKNLMYDLIQLLNKGSWDYGVYSLETIKSAINDLQQNQFTTQPEAIDKAVTAIKAELGELRGKLKNGNKGDDVIERLNDLKNKDLVNEPSWKTITGGQNLSGLGKIEDRKIKNEIVTTRERSRSRKSN
ncbi:Extracellular matrix-binding ebh, putative [Babesia ovata]|uniref:Extracellular matrix-binding ebh, putative n=1 Tax=Babesia ovata TaxID=189622 RepID=A0A2H6KAM9_9APIC|nr:Extracellular matrix-binding ebh, putative [Babesia ovata]GBE60057.1 Extracellular matrix-binding ebh, putative [Babesia ovata]